MRWTPTQISSIHQTCRMPPFDKIDASKHTHHRSWKRNFTEEQWQLCVQHPELIIKTPPTVGRLGGFIWKFQKNFGGKTLQIVAEVYKSECYPITGYWLGE